MVTGIISLLNSFGVEMNKFTSSGIYGLSILAIFALFWIVLYHFMSKKGENKTPLSKGVPPLVSFIATVALITDISSKGVVLKSQAAFLSMFLGFFGFILTLISAGLLIWIGILANKRLQNAWGKLTLCTVIFVATSLLLPHFSAVLGRGLSETGAFTLVSEGFIFKNFGDQFSVIEDILALINTLSMLGMFWFLFKAFGSLGVVNLKGVYKWQKEVRSERTENIKILNDATRRIEILMKQGSDIYKQVSEVIKNKSQVNKISVYDKLESWKSTILQLKKELNEIENIDLDKVKFKIDSILPGRANHNEAEKMELSLSNLNRVIDEMVNQISVILKDTSRIPNDIYSQLYNIAMGWYNFATGYEKVSSKVKVEIDALKEDLDLLVQIENKEKEIISLKLSFENKGAITEFELAKGGLINSIILGKINNSNSRLLRLNMINLVLIELNKFLDLKKYNIFKGSVPASENTFEFLIKGIIEEISKKHKDIKLDNLSSLIPEIQNLLNILFNDGEKIKDLKLFESKKKELENYFKQLDSQKKILEQYNNDINKLPLDKVKSITKTDLIKNLRIILSNFTKYQEDFLSNCDLDKKANFLNSFKNNLNQINYILDKFEVFLNQIASYDDTSWNKNKPILIPQLENLIKILNSDEEILQLELTAIQDKLDKNIK